MDKNRLQKLELDGFTSAAQRRKPPLWKTRAADLADKICKPIGRIKTRPAPKEADEEPQNIDATYKRLLIKTGICAVIAIAILTISSIDSPVTNSITEAIDDAVNHEFDIDEDIGKLKFVQSLDDETESVFSALPDASVVYPVEGEIITEYGENGAKGVRIVPVESEVVSIAKGTVTTVGTIDGMGYVKIVLDAGETAVFYNIAPTAQVDDIVYPGQSIGDVTGDFLYLEMTSDGEYIDPIAYIEQRAAMVVQ